MEAAQTSGISTVIHESAAVLIGAADAQAIRTAERQKKDVPWRCAKRDLVVTNAECLSDHILAVTRSCRDCGIPKILPKPKEGQAMAKGNCECCDVKDATIYRQGGVNRCYHCHKGKVCPQGLPVAKSSEPEPAPTLKAVPVSDVVPSWRDFIPFTNQETGCFVRITRGKVHLSAEASTRSKFKKGDMLEFASNPLSKQIAIRIAQPESVYTVKCYGREGRSLCVACATLLKKLGVNERSGLPVEFHPWGIVIKAGE